MTAAEPHPSVRDLVVQRDLWGVLRFSDLSVDGARRLLEQLCPVADEPEPVAAVRTLSIAGPGGDLPVRLYTPEGTPPFPVLVYAHGGGFVMGSLDTDDAICRALVNAARAVVVSVDYRLAPEHPFPAALEDFDAVTRWVAERPAVVQGDPGRLAVGGESAGGTLAAAVAQAARDRDGPELTHQVLVYPPTDASMDAPSYEEDPTWHVITKADGAWLWDHYLESPFDGHNPYASPLAARDLSELPPATILTCGFDVLRDEAVAYADRLEAAGVPVSHRHEADMVHGFVGQLHDPELPRAREAVTAIGTELRAAFGE